MRLAERSASPVLRACLGRFSWWYNYRLEQTKSRGQQAIGDAFDISLFRLKLIPGPAMPLSLPLAKEDAYFGGLANFISGAAQRLALGLGWEGPTAWSTNAHYLVGDARGWITDYRATNTTAAFLLDLKTFVGAGVACGLFDLPTLFPLFPALRYPLFVYHLEQKSDGPKFCLKRSQYIPAQYSHKIEGLLWHDDLSQTGSAALESRVSRLRFLLGIVRVVFAERTEAAPLRLATQWYFDSLGSDELLSFVQVIVALKILLGDKATAEKVGVGKLLANRCAYLLGATNA